MMKYLLAGLPLLLAACSSTVDVQDEAEYKCGEQIVYAQMLDDESMIVKINGVNNVLARVASASGERYENIATRVTFSEMDGEKYLSINGRNYPVCQEIKR
ncbi:MAG: MliC family protein [Alphaproteobacteria bacterium]|nr:MliC family protein [Alphaproteobacteria bacterium]